MNKYWSKEAVRKRQRSFIVNKFSNNQTIMRKSIKLAFEGFWKSGNLSYLISTIELSSRVVGIDNVVKMIKKYIAKSGHQDFVRTKDLQILLDDIMLKQDKERVKK